MTNTNEITTVNAQTGEILVQDTVIRETADYTISQKADGKFVRKAKFNNFSSIKAENRADKIWLMGVLEGGEENGNGLKSHVGKELEVQDIITRTYDRINEDTGEMEYGVLTYLITPKKEVFVTSSKTVYFSITRIMDLFGKPGEEGWENIILLVGKEKGQNGDIIKVKMIG